MHRPVPNHRGPWEGRHGSGLQVYKGLDPHIERTIALKIMRKGMLDEEAGSSIDAAGIEAQVFPSSGPPLET